MSGGGVTPLAPQLRNMHCPAPLRGLEHWLMWRYEENPVPGKKPLKVPYYVTGEKRHGVQGGPADLGRLTTFEAARSAAIKREMTGVGIAMLGGTGIVALDFDACVVDGVVNDSVLAMIAGTYCEYSPSLTGVRAFVRAGDVGNHKSQARDGGWGFETFASSGFVTVTGNMLDGVELCGLEDTIGDVSALALMEMQARFGAKREPRAAVGKVARATGDDVDGLEELFATEARVGLGDAELLRLLEIVPAGELPYESDYALGPSWLGVGMAIHHETEGSDWGFAIWDRWSSQSVKYGGEKYGWERWRSFGKRTDGVMTARTLKGWARAVEARDDAPLALDADPGDDDFDVQAEPSAAKPAAAGGGDSARWPIVGAAAFSAGTNPGWLIKGVLPRAKLAMIFGPSGSGKTFMVTDLAMSVARGVDWRGLRTRQGGVLYVAAEGAGGFRKRLTAYGLRNGVDLAAVPFGVIAGAPSLLEKDDVVDVARSARRWDEELRSAGGEGIRLVVVDTLSQTLAGGNENAGEDVGLALKHCAKLSDALGGATVMLVHHSGISRLAGAVQSSSSPCLPVRLFHLGSTSRR